MVHLGKHGNLGGCPARPSGCPRRGSDAALGDLPLIYRSWSTTREGTQAKRRAHATLVDHLIRRWRAESYGDIARLEQLLDEHANIAALDLGKLPAIRQQIWTLMRAAKMDHDLGLAERPEDDSFDDMLLHVDGWLCEIKDVQIRDGLHVPASPRTGPPNSIWSGDPARPDSCSAAAAPVPGLRRALGLRAGDGSDEPGRVDDIEERARDLQRALQATGWAAAGRRADRRTRVARILRFAATEVVPRLAGTARDRPGVRALEGAASSPRARPGSGLRGLVSVLPTGRNFYSVDPKAVPSRLA